jgi:hypothetical protein
MSGLLEVARASGWWWPFAGAVVLTERPSHIARDEQHRLHDEKRAAIEYRDGFGVYAWHGVRVPPYVITHPENITTELIDAEQNAEVRRVMLERFGLARYVTESKCEVLDEDTDSLGLPRRLLRKPPRPGSEDEPIVMLDLNNSTLEPSGERKKYVLRVHPEIRPMLDDGRLGPKQMATCLNAVASTFGMTGAEYRLVAES